jgi:hypothetical protein
MNNDIKGDEVKKVDGRFQSLYLNFTKELKTELDSVSPSFCLAKWYHVSLHIPTGRTQSCYHPKMHKIPLEEIAVDVTALHNTKYKKQQRQLMLDGQRPQECNYCWQIEDSGTELSDRAYRSLDVFEEGILQEVKDLGALGNARPRYLEVNFNQGCNFKCSYCSPHLSSAWQQEVESLGPVQLDNHKHNDLSWMTSVDMMPNNKLDNPYLLAFWQWLPDIYPKLKTFRMTGGEPLMDKNTFRMFEYIKKHPNPKLQLGITSNCCPPGDQWSKFMLGLKEVTPSIDHFMLFCSLDSWGAQAEYIRNGMDFNVLYNNVTDFLKNGNKHSLTFIITFNALSYTRWEEYIRNILLLRQTYSKDRQLIWFDIPMLHSPDWLSPKLFPEMIHILERSLEFMLANKESEYSRFKGFKDFEISKVTRLINWVKQTDKFNKERAEHNFYLFFKQHDQRRNTDFVKTFPELTDFWNRCKDIYDR